MNVQQMIDLLLSVSDKSRIVVMSKDSEGNCYSPFGGFSECMYDAETTWYGELVEEEDEYEGADPAICLWPVN
jgi:hypothetical protein